MAAARRKISWSEKYRPRTWGDFVDQDEIKKRLAQAIADNELTNWLFVGPPGLGKSSLVRLFAYQYFQHFNELNERGEPPGGLFHAVLLTSETASTKTVRDLEQYAKSAFPFRQDLFRIIFLDEIDRFTPAAAKDLRPLLEGQTKWAAKTVVLATTNNPQLNPEWDADVRAAILSRFTVLRFERPSDEQIIARLEQVASAEGCTVAGPTLRQVATESRGGLRDAVKLLQDRCLLLSVGEKALAMLAGPGELERGNFQRGLETKDDFNTVEKLAAALLDPKFQPWQKEAIDAELTKRDDAFLSGFTTPLRTPTDEELRRMLAIVRRRSEVPDTSRYVYRGALYTEERYMDLLRDAASRKGNLQVIVGETQARPPAAPSVTLAAFEEAAPPAPLPPVLQSEEMLVAEQRKHGWTLMERQRGYIRFYRGPPWERQDVNAVPGYPGAWTFQLIESVLRPPDTAVPITPPPPVIPAVLREGGLPADFEDYQGELTEELGQLVQRARSAGVVDDDIYSLTNTFLVEQTRTRDAVAAGTSQQEGIEQLETVWQWTKERLEELIIAKTPMIPEPAAAPPPALPAPPFPEAPAFAAPPEAVPATPPGPSDEQMAAFKAEVRNAALPEIEEAHRAKEWFGKVLEVWQDLLLVDELRRRGDIQPPPGFVPPPAREPTPVPPTETPARHQAEVGALAGLETSILQGILQRGEWAGRPVDRALIEAELRRRNPEQLIPVGPSRMTAVRREDLKQKWGSYGRDFLIELLGDETTTPEEREVISEVLSGRDTAIKTQHGKDYEKALVKVKTARTLEMLDAIAQQIRYGFLDRGVLRESDLTPSDKIELLTEVEDKRSKLQGAFAQVQVIQRETGRPPSAEEDPVKAVVEARAVLGTCANCGELYPVFDAQTLIDLSGMDPFGAYPTDFLYSCPRCQMAGGGRTLLSELQEASVRPSVPRASREYFGQLANTLTRAFQMAQRPVLDTERARTIAKRMWEQWKREVIVHGVVAAWGRHIVEIEREFGKEIAGSTSAPQLVITVLRNEVDRSADGTSPEGSRLWRSAAALDILRTGLANALQKQPFTFKNIYAPSPVDYERTLKDLEAGLPEKL